jgi:hypothetical protein
MSSSAAHFEQWCARVSLGVMESIRASALRRAQQFELETGHTVDIVYPAVAPASGVGMVAREMHFMSLTLDGVEVHLFSARNPGKPPTVHMITPSDQLNPHSVFSRDPRPMNVPKSSPRASAPLMSKSGPAASAPSSEERSRPAGTVLMKGPTRPQAAEPLTQTAPMTPEEKSQPVSSKNPYGTAPPSSAGAPLNQTARMNVSDVNERTRPSADLASEYFAPPVSSGVIGAPVSSGPRINPRRTPQPEQRAPARQELAPMVRPRPAAVPSAIGAEMSRPPASMRELARHRIQTIPLCQAVPTEDGGFVLLKARSADERVKMDDVVFRVFEELVNRWRRLNGG